MTVVKFFTVLLAGKVEMGTCGGTGTVGYCYR